MSDPVVGVDDVGKAFGSNVVLRTASFAACAGHVTVLLGRNGAGKTTLFRIAIGHVRADHGRVVYRGVHRERPSLARLASEGLMYSAQESALTPLLSVREHFDACAAVFGGRERIGPILESLSLGELANRRPPRLSGGERQRASLGLALLRSPDCLLMDEPFAGVAPRDRPMIADGLRRLRERGAAIAVSGHDVTDLLAVSDEVIWVTAGTTHWLGSPEQAERHDQFRREYLGPSRSAR